jgi:solute:Na+ symporter, SSS family
LSAALFHGLALPSGAAAGIKGGWIAPEFVFRSEMGQNFYVAIVAWCACFVLTVAVSLATRRNKSDADLHGLVYSLTPRPPPQQEPWFRRPVLVGLIVLGITLLLNILFR